MRSLPIAAMTLALFGVAPAYAQCKLTTIEVPVTMNGLRPMVEAKIMAQPVKLILDSGAFSSHLDQSIVDQLKLKPMPVAKMGSLIPTGAGTFTSGAAGRVGNTGIEIVPSFEFAGTRITDVEFLSSAAIHDAAGLLGQNVLLGVDDEYDFKNGMLRLVKPAGCEAANLAYWVKPGSGYNVAELEHLRRDDPHTVAVIEINGVKMRAYLDTGAETSFITERAAGRAGVKTTDPDVTPAGSSRGLDRAAIKTWVGRFASVKIGTEEIKNVRLSIGESQASDFDMLLGADFFLAHHVYVANSQNKIYFTYEGGPVFRAAQALEAPAGGKAP
jgi:hypothetical protein